MRILFATDEAPKRAATKLCRVPPLGTIGRATALDVTAYCMGYKDWYELRHCLGMQIPDLLDDFVTDDIREARRQYFACRLGEQLVELGHHVSKDVLLQHVDIWSPLASSEARPATNRRAVRRPSPLSPQERARRLTHPVILHHRRILYCNKYREFFGDMLEWPLRRLPGPIEPARPFATTPSTLFNQDIPLLAPASVAGQPGRTEADMLAECARAFPAGAILLVDNPGPISEHNVQAWSPGYFLTTSACDRIHISPTMDCFDALFDIENGKASLRVVPDIGHWAERTFQEMLTGFRPTLAGGYGDDGDDFDADMFADIDED
jgi:hypothetical protein